MTGIQTIGMMYQGETDNFSNRGFSNNVICRSTGDATQSLYRSPNPLT